MAGIVADAPAGFGDRIIDCLLHLLDGLIDLRRGYLPLPEDALIGERTKVSCDYEAVYLDTSVLEILGQCAYRLPLLAEAVDDHSGEFLVRVEHLTW